MFEVLPKFAQKNSKMAKIGHGLMICDVVYKVYKVLHTQVLSSWVLPNQVPPKA
jgi:hypothetical protein